MLTKFSLWRVLATVLILLLCVGCGGNPAAGVRESQQPRAASAQPMLSTLDDLKDKRIGVQLGTVYDIYATKTFPGAKVVQSHTYQDVTLAVSAGKVDAGLSDVDTLNEVMRANPDLVPFGKPIFSSPVAAGFTKQSAALRKQFDDFLAGIRKSGLYAEMVDRWMTKRSTQMPEIALPKDGETLVVGISSGGFPFCAVQNNELAGFDVELATRFAASIGKQVKLADQEFGGLIAALVSGKIDVIIADMFVTAERQKQIDFSQPYFEQDSVAFTVKANTVAQQPRAASAQPMLSTLDDLKDKRIGVQLGTVYDIYATKTFPGAKVVQYHTYQDVTLAVSAGKVDAGLSDVDTLNEVMRANPDLVPFGKPIFSSPVAAGFTKQSAALRKQFDDFLAGIRKSGLYAEMVDRWMTKRSTQMPEIALPKDGETLVVGISSGGFPFCAVQNNELAGFDVELATRFAASIGKQVKLADQEFGGLIAALVSGKIDVIIADMFVTAERQKQIDFSQPYFEQDSVAFTVKANTVAQQPRAASAQPMLSTLDDLKDKRIGVQLGTVYDIYATKTFPGAKVVQYHTYQDVTLAVSAGKVDAGLSDVDTLNEVMRANPDLVPFGKPIFSSPVAAGFTKQSAALRKQFDDFLAGIRKSGLYAEMVDRWMTKRSTQMPEIALPKDGETLVVGISSGGFPFCAVQNNELAGFDVELATRFAASIGKQVKLADQEFGGLIAALVSGKIDVIIADMFVTAERQKQIDFSQPYFEQDSVAFTVKANTVAAVAAQGEESAPKSFFERVAASFQANIIQEQRYLLLWDGLTATALISVFAALFGTALGALVCFLRMSSSAFLRLPAMAYISVLRGMPVLVLLMLIFYVVFGSLDVSPVLVAIIAFGMNFAAYVSEMFRSGIESLDRGQFEAGTAMGFTRTQAFGYIVLPQLIQRILPVYKGEFISLVKMTSIVGYVAVQDLTKAGDIIRSRTFDAFFPLIMVAVLYFLIAWVLMLGLGYLERVTDPKSRRQKAGAR